MKGKRFFLFYFSRYFSRDGLTHGPVVLTVDHMPVISFKVSAEHARHLRRAARVKHATVSEYLREATKPDAPPRRRMMIRMHPISGLPYDASPGPVVTDAMIKEALADFP